MGVSRGWGSGGESVVEGVCGRECRRGSVWECRRGSVWEGV